MNGFVQDERNAAAQAKSLGGPWILTLRTMNIGTKDAKKQAFTKITIKIFTFFILVFVFRIAYPTRTVLPKIKVTVGIATININIALSIIFMKNLVDKSKGVCSQDDRLG